MYTLAEVIKVLEEMAPPVLAENWDHIGLMIGSRKQKVSKVLCALDVTEEVIHEAVQNEIQCIVTHHPFLFKPVYTIDFDTPKGQQIRELISHNISVYAMHTNFDVAEGGINDILCEKLGIKHAEILHITHEENLCKAAVYVPEESYEEVRDTIIRENTCQIGSYKGCSFAAEGEGAFIPLEGSRPYIGMLNKLEKLKERKIEFVAYKNSVQHIFEEIKKVHPYEEVAFDVFSLNNLKLKNGIGRFGVLEETISLKAFIQRVKEVFGLSHIRITNPADKNVKHIAVCSGSGAEYIRSASKIADVYLTADIKFHEAQEANALGLTLIDVGHYASENIAIKNIADRLNQRLKGLYAIPSVVNAEVIHIQ